MSEPGHDGDRDDAKARPDDDMVRRLLTDYAKCTSESMARVAGASLLQGVGIPVPAEPIIVERADALISRAIDRSDLDESHRRAATVMFVGRGRSQWPSLTVRYRKAAAHLQLSQSGFTRTHRGSSHYERILTSVSAALLETPDATAPAPTTDEAGADAPPPVDVARASTDGQRPSRRHILVGVPVLVVAIAAVIALVVRSHGTDTSAANATTPVQTPSTSAVANPTTSSPVASTTTIPAPTTTTALATACPIAPGTPDLALAAADVDRLAGLSSTFAAQLGGSECASAPVRLFGLALLMEVRRGDAATGAVIAPLDGTPLRLTQAQWSTYREIAGHDQPENSISLGGYPVSIDVTADGVEIELSGGGLLVGRSPDDPHFWVPSLAGVRTIWEQSGGLTGSLGLPTSNPFVTAGVYEQDYQHGFLRGPQDLSQATVVYVDRPLDALARFQSLEGHILRQAGGQAYLVDDERIAHWIPDGPTWDCLGGQSRLLRPDVPGYAIWALEVGDTATCPNG